LWHYAISLKVMGSRSDEVTSSRTRLGIYLASNRNEYQKKLRGLSLRAKYLPSDSRLSAKLVPTFADRGCHVVSVTDPYGRILGFLDRNE
jgi:CBS-domain-containing membrane protein